MAPFFKAHPEWAGNLILRPSAKETTSPEEDNQSVKIMLHESKLKIPLNLSTP